MSHLTPEQVIAYRDGELQDPSVTQHLAVCETCRAEVADARLMRALLHPPPDQPPGRHPTDETLAAYFDHALPIRQTAKIEAHLRSCDHCVAQWMALRKATLRPAEFSPPAALAEKAKRQFSTRHQRGRLGRVMVETLEGLALRLTIGSVFTIIQYPTSQSTEPSQARAPLPPAHPSSASARRKRLGRWPKMREDTDADIHEILTPIRLPFSVSGLAIGGLATTGALFSSRPLISRAEVPFEFEADTVLLRVTITRNRRGAILTAVARDASSKTPVQGIELTLVPAQDIPMTAKTNRQGTARFRLPIGESDLLIQTQQLWVLRLNFLSKEN